MNHVTTLFNSNEFGELRTIIIENEVYFVAKSVATALGYKDTADAIRKHIDEEDKLRWQIADTGQKREIKDAKRKEIQTLGNKRSTSTN